MGPMEGEGPSIHGSGYERNYRGGWGRGIGRGGGYINVSYTQS